MTITCKNCHHSFKGSYCYHCGQSAETHEINFHFMWHDIEHGLLHLDKGIFFTIKELFSRPGQSIREFIEGKRVRHFKPISLVIVLAGIYGFLYHYFDIRLLQANVVFNGQGKEVEEYRRMLESVNQWIGSHYAIVALAQVPLYAVGTFLAFRKRGYNFAEHLVLNAFLTGQKLLVYILAFPLTYFYNGDMALRTIDGYLNLIGFSLFFWTLFTFFPSQPKLGTFWRILLSLFIFLVLYISLAALTGFLIVKSGN